MNVTVTTQHWVRMKIRRPYPGRHDPGAHDHGDGLGDPISDTATLSGATSDATGTMTFKLYGPFTDPDPSTDTCDDPDPANNVAGNLVTTIERTLLGSRDDASGNYVVSSGDYTPTTAGRYQWVVSYGGDANNEAVSSEWPRL